MKVAKARGGGEKERRRGRGCVMVIQLAKRGEGRVVVALA